MFGNEDMMFSIIPVFVITIFAVIILAFIVAAIKGTMKWSYNNSQPILSVSAILVAKRIELSTTSYNNTKRTNHYSDSKYFITFEFESGSRKEFLVQGIEYGLLVEGDSGQLKLQGDRYLGFQRFAKAV